MKLARRRYRMCFLVADEYRECQTFLCETPSSDQRKVESALLTPHEPGVRATLATRTFPLLIGDRLQAAGRGAVGSAIAARCFQDDWRQAAHQVRMKRPEAPRVLPARVHQHRHE